MKLTVISVVSGVFGTVVKVLLQRLEDLEIRGRVETILTTALSRSARILWIVLEIEETCCHSNEKQSTNAGVNFF